MIPGSVENKTDSSFNVTASKWQQNLRPKVSPQLSTLRFHGLENTNGVLSIIKWKISTTVANIGKKSPIFFQTVSLLEQLYFPEHGLLIRRFNKSVLQIYQ